MNTKKNNTNKPNHMKNNIELNGKKNVLNFAHQYERPARFSTTKFVYTAGISYITYPGVRPFMYTVDTEGNVYNVNTNYKLTPFIGSTGYLVVALQQEFGYTKNFLLHRLVAYQFCPIPTDVPFETLTVNHITGNRADNSCGNLEWISYAYNTQHEMEVLHNGGDRNVVNGRPIANNEFVRWICEQLQLGKSNTQIMREAGMEIVMANHTFIRDIRNRTTWANISKDYTFNQSSKPHAYTKEERALIGDLLVSGMSMMEVFKYMQGREYTTSDNGTSEYKTIYSEKTKAIRQGRM